MAEMTLTGALAAQYGRAWFMLRDGVRKVPEDQWKVAEPTRLAPARLALHAVAPAVLYCEQTEADTKPWGRELGRLWADAPIEEFPSQAELLEWLDEVEPAIDAWLRGLDEARLLAPQDEFKHTGACLLERIVYTLRHIQHHVGELNAECVRRDVPRPDWR
jgi:hypothetical protein